MSRGIGVQDLKKETLRIVILKLCFILTIDPWETLLRGDKETKKALVRCAKSLMATLKRRNGHNVSFGKIPEDFLSWGYLAAHSDNLIHLYEKYFGLREKIDNETKTFGDPFFLRKVAGSETTLALRLNKTSV